MSIRVLLLALMLLVSPFLQVGRCQSEAGTETEAAGSTEKSSERGMGNDDTKNGARYGSRLAAPLILIIIALIECVPKYFELRIKNGGAMNDEEKRLRAEIKKLLKEASMLTQPSTFAQAAKLRRNAAAKEKELAKYQEQQMLERRSSYDPYMKYVFPVKALTWLVLGVWYWKSPVAAIPKELLQPVGGILSFRSGAHSKDKVMVGVLAWMMLCSKVAKLIFRKFVM